MSAHENLSTNQRINEESLKLLGVAALFLLPRARLVSALDGLFRGAVLGLGFLVVEDYIYTVQQSAGVGDVVGFLVSRGFVAGLFAHASYTAPTARILGAGRNRS